MTELMLEVEELEARVVPAFIWIDDDSEVPAPAPTDPVPPVQPTPGG